MGYDTTFTGALFFTRELMASELAILRNFLDVDCRDHPEWEYDKDKSDLTYIDLNFNDDFTGLCWNEAEKSYDMVAKINLVIRNVKKKIPDFELRGVMYARGEEVGDVWKIVFDETGKAVSKEIPLEDDEEVLTCPNCENRFCLWEGRRE